MPAADARRRLSAQMRSSGPATEGVLLEYVSADLILNGQGIELEELQGRMKAMGCVSPPSGPGCWRGVFALSVLEA